MDDSRPLKKIGLLGTPYFPPLYATVGDSAEPTLIMEHFDSGALPDYLAPYINQTTQWVKSNRNLDPCRAAQTSSMLLERVVWKIFSDLVQPAAIAIRVRGRVTLVIVTQLLTDLIVV